MKLWPFGRQTQPTEAKYSEAGPLLSRPVLGQPQWTSRDFAKLAEAGYVRNAVANRCVRMISQNCANIPLLLRQGDELIESHPLLDLLDRPNPRSTRSSFFEAVVSYLLMTGNSYIEAVPGDNVKRPPSELWVIRPDRMRVIPGPYGMPQAYQYEAGGGRKRWPADPKTGASQILHLLDFSPVDDFYGLGSVQPAAYGIDRHNAAGAHNKALLDNGARPSGAFVMKPVKLGADEYRMAPQEVVDAAVKKLGEDHTGPDNAGKPFVLTGDAEWVPMGINPRDMDFNEGKRDAARDIALAMGVPPMLLGIPGDNTYSNYKEARLAFYEDTVLPMIDTICEWLSLWLGPRYGEGLVLEADRDEIPALEARREMRRSSVVELLDKNVISVEEAREALQYGKPSPDHVSVGIIDASVLSALIAVMPQTGEQPLYRYLRSVGLFDPTKTLKQMLSDASALVENDEDDEDDTLTPPPNGNDGDDDDDDDDGI